MPQYFDPSPEVPRQLCSFTESLRGESFRFTTDAATFSRHQLDDGTRLLLEAALADPQLPCQGAALDLAAGWGPVSSIMGRFCPRLEWTLAEVNPRALAMARRNLEINLPGARPHFHEGDGIAQLAESFQLILLNPPIRAGKAVYFRLFAEAQEHLRPGGRLYIVVQKKQGADSCRRELERLFGAQQVADIARGGGYHVFRAVRRADPTPPPTEAGA